MLLSLSPSAISLVGLKQAASDSQRENMCRRMCNHGHVHGAVQLIVFTSLSSSSCSVCPQAAQGCKGRAQSYLIPCHHPPLPQCYRSVYVCPRPPGPRSHSTPPLLNQQAPSPPTPNPSTSLPRSLIQCVKAPPE